MLGHAAGSAVVTVSMTHTLCKKLLLRILTSEAANVIFCKFYIFFKNLTTLTSLKNVSTTFSLKKHSLFEAVSILCWVDVHTSTAARYQVLHAAGT